MKIIALNKQVLFFENYSRHCDTLFIYPDYSRLSKLLRRIHYRYFKKKFDIWYANKFKTCGKDTDSIIIFDSFLTVPAANYIKKRHPDLRVIYWFWNHIYDDSVIKKLSPDIELWSYDPEDCKKYNLRFNTQFYFKDLSTLSDSPIKQDFLFVGAEKGRGMYINQCAQLIEDAGLSKEFIVSDNTRKDRIKKWIPYDDLICKIQQSKCIVDIVPDAQKGLTLRPMEAIFLKKKLITNFRNIKTEKFYNPSNIFVIGEDNPEELESFINSPMKEIDSSLIEYYEFNNWINRFNN